MSGQGVLTLDLASLCGWARYIDGKLVGSGVWDLGKKRGEGDGARMVKLNAHLAALDPRPALIVYELPMHHAGARAAHVFGALEGKTHEYAEVYSVPHGALTPSQIKKHATGDGRAEKPEMMAAAAERWGIEIVDDNHGDALCLLAAWLDDVRMKGCQL